MIILKGTQSITCEYKGRLYADEHKGTHVHVYELKGALVYELICN